MLFWNGTGQQHDTDLASRPPNVSNNMPKQPWYDIGLDALHLHGHEQLGDGRGQLRDTDLASGLPIVSENKPKQSQQPRYDIGIDYLHLH